MSYPQTPGHRKDDASRAAAKRMRTPASNLRQRVFDQFWCRHNVTTLELSDFFGLALHSVGPRFTELEKMGLITKIGSCVQQQRRVAKWTLSEKALVEQIHKVPKFQPDRHTMTGWVNVYRYPSAFVLGTIHPTKADARRTSEGTSSVIACVAVTVHFAEGEGL